MMKSIIDYIETMITTLASNTDAVKAKSRVALDADKVANHFSKSVGRRFDNSVKERMESFRGELDSMLSQAGEMGAERLSEASVQVEKVVEAANAVVSKCERLERRMVFVGIGRLALALLPIAVAVFIVGGLLWGFAGIFGIGPLFGWAWASFTAATVWWHKGLIALGTLGGAGLFVFIVLRMAGSIADELR